jgi:oligopeptide transport system substrate-binding protein
VKYLKILALIFSTLFLFACSDEGKYTELVKNPTGDSYSGGVFRMNETESFSSLYPLSITDASARNIAGQIFEGLVKLNPEDLSPMPALAERWVINADATSFVFIIRKGVKFHDNSAFPDNEGRELNSKDVKYCFTQLCTDSPENQGFWIFKDRVVGATSYFNSTTNGAPLKNGVEGIKVLNNYAIQIDLKYPSPDFLKILAMPFAWIYPKEAKEHFGDKINLNPIGTGAFRFKKWKTGTSVMLLANENYWDKDEFGNTLPYLKALKFKFLPQDEAIKSFEKKGLDMIFNPDADFSHKPFIAQNIQSFQTLYLGFQNQGKIFNNLNVRLAFQYAIDRDMIVKEVFNGKGIMASGGIVPPFFDGFDASKLSGNAYNPEAAKNYLEIAGYPNAAGFPEVKMLVNSESGKVHQMLSDTIAEMLRRNLGVNVVVVKLPFKAYLNTFETGSVDMFLESFKAEYESPENFLNNLHSSHFGKDSLKRKYKNSAGYINAAYDSLFKMGQKELDLSLKHHLFLRASQLLMNDAAVMPIVHPQNTRYLQPFVRNFPINTMEYRDFSRVWFDQISYDKGKR